MSTAKIARTVLVFGLLSALALVSTGCMVVETVEREDRTDRDTVALDGAEELHVDIDMGAGRLDVASDGRRVARGDAMDAEFTYDMSSWKPIVEYEARGVEGELAVRQPTRPSIGPFGDIKYEWDLALSDEVPLYIAADMGAGEVNFDLADAQLREFKLSLGAGDTSVDLVGDYTDDVDVKIDGGAGQITVRLPEGVGVRVSIDQGIGQIVANGFSMDNGDYVNGAYEDAEHFIDVEITAGVGQINLILEG